MEDLFGRKRLSKRGRRKRLNGYHYYGLIHGKSIEEGLPKRAGKRKRYNLRQKIIGEQWRALPVEIQNSHYNVFMNYHRELLGYMADLETALQQAIKQGFVPTKNAVVDDDDDSNDDLRQTPPTPIMRRQRKPVRRLSPTFVHPTRPRKQKLFPVDECREQKFFPNYDGEQDSNVVIQDLFPSIFESCSEPLPVSVVSTATMGMSAPSPQEILYCPETNDDLDMLDKLLS